MTLTARPVGSPLPSVGACPPVPVGVAGVLAGIAAAPADRPALVCPDTGVLSYGELRALVAQCAATLPVRVGGLVLLAGDRDLGTVVSYLACLSTGRACALVDAATPVAAQQDQLRAYRPDAVLSSARAADAVALDAGYRPAVVLPGGTRLLLPPAAQPAPAGERALAGDGAAGEPGGAGEQTALLLATSGSSGAPRMVRLSLSNVDGNTAAIARALRLTADDRAVTSLPLHYCYGLSVLNAHLAAGASVVLSRAGAPSRPLWRTAIDSGVTQLAGVPSTFAALHRGALRLDQLPGLRQVTQAGGRLPVDAVLRLHAELDRISGRFAVMYGQTEATARITVLDHEDIPERPDSVGRPVAGTTVRIEDSVGRPLPDGAVGEVVVHGAGVMLGYATGRADLLRGNGNGGRLRTGDLGRLDGGYLTICGRAARFAKVAGRRVDLDGVEVACRAIGEVAVIATPDERIHICVPGDPGPFTAARQALARDLRIPVGQLHVVVVDAVPHTGSGKVDYPALAVLAARAVAGDA